MLYIRISIVLSVKIMSHFTHPLEFQAHVCGLAWKQKMALFRSVEEQIVQGTLQVPQVVI